MNPNKCEKIIEAILFASGNSFSLKKISELLNLDLKSTRLVIKNLSDKYYNEERGIVIIEVGEEVQMCTNPIYFDYLKELFGTKPKKKLTQTLLETLAIVAYKQPITKNDIEEIRGVSAEHAINKLIEYELVCEKGRLESPGKPIIFGTTDEFLKYYGYSGLDRLPILKTGSTQEQGFFDH